MNRPDRACAECAKHGHCVFKWAYGPKSNCAGWVPEGCLTIHWSKEERIMGQESVQNEPSYTTELPMLRG